LFLSEATVKAHVSRLLLKMGATNRVQLAITALDAGLRD
jgi:DNA-binding NarL/FixJ family response regulator